MTDAPRSDAERAKAFREERQARLRAQLALVADTDGEVRRLLAEALVRIKAALADTPSDYAEWRLTQLQAEVERVLTDMADGASSAISAGLSKSWAGGAALVDAPLAAAGVLPRLVALDGTVLRQMQAFCTDRIRSVKVEAMNRIGSELGLTMIGIQSPFDATQKVAGILGSAEKRAVTITRTELGRAWSTAAQARQEQAVAAGVTGLQKQWRRSGKRHPRHAHEAIDGQVRPVDQPFQLERGVTLMFPRDPKGPPEETINCGCVSLPIMKHWEVSHPKERPFTQEELDTSPHRRLLQDARYSGFERWADQLMPVRDAAGNWQPGPLRPTGRFETVATIEPAILQALDTKKVRLATREIAITDRELVGLRAARKVEAKPGKQPTALPESVVRDLPALLAAPKAVLWDRLAKHGPQLVYVVDVPGEQRLGKVIVKLRDQDTRARNSQRHNWITSGGLVDRVNLNDVESYERLDRPGVKL